MPFREDIRDVAIVAHVDHGKTTLVDADAVAVRLLPREPGRRRACARFDGSRAREGITILAKNTAVRYGGFKINIVDTPGHADFGGEVERALTMVDGVLLLVDASEGPLPQTRFVLRKALEARLPLILVVNKVDRPDARIDEVVNEVYELFLDLDADESQIEFRSYTPTRAGRAGLESDQLADDLRPLFDMLLAWILRRSTTRAIHSKRTSRTSTSPHVGRLALCRVREGTVRKPADPLVPLRRPDRASEGDGPVRDRGTRSGRGRGCGSGELVAVAGLAEVTIGETPQIRTIRARSPSSVSTSRASR